MIENRQNWHQIQLVVKQAIGHKNDVQVLKKLRKEYDFFFCPLAQLLI